MTDLRNKIRQSCVLSKIAEKPLVIRHATQTFVCIRGYPMTLRGFYALVMKAVLNQRVKIPYKFFQELNQETILLCEGLALDLAPDTESISVSEGIAKALDWNETTAKNSRETILSWVESVEADILSLGR